VPDALPIHVRSSVHNAGTIVRSKGYTHDGRSKGLHGTSHTEGIYSPGHGGLVPSLAPLPLSVAGNATRHKEKAYGRVLKTRVSEVWRQTVLRDLRVMAAHHRGEGQLLSTIFLTISPGTCSLQHPIYVASRPIRHTIISGFALKIRTSFRHRNPDPTECPKHNTGIGGAHSVQEGTWAVKLTCTSHAQSRHHWHIHSSQSSAFVSRGMVSRNISRWHFS
jgi:hypothetical protein